MNLFKALFALATTLSVGVRFYEGSMGVDEKGTYNAFNQAVKNCPETRQQETFNMLAAIAMGCQEPSFLGLTGNDEYGRGDFWAVKNSLYSPDTPRMLAIKDVASGQYDRLRSIMIGTQFAHVA